MRRHYLMRLVSFWSSVEWVFWCSFLELCGLIGLLSDRPVKHSMRRFFGKPTCVGLNSCALGARHMVPFV
jgi:hypothetical protein